MHPSTSGTDPEQEKRTAKALLGLADGSLHVCPIEPDCWRVQTSYSDRAAYLVVRSSTGWACDCPDWSGRCRTTQLRCKHIEAVRLSPPAASPHSIQSNPPYKETYMDPTQPSNSMPCGWTKLYHPSGVQVTIPISISEAVSPESAKVMLYSVTALLEAGWQANMPGLDAGERVEEIRHVVRRVKTNDDNTETPVIDLYPDRANFRILGVYLNTPAHVQAFESVCGVQVADLPLYDGDNAIERGKGPKTDKYVVTLPRPVRVVLKQNPRWEGEDDKKHPKRLFVRWLDVPPAGDGNAAEPMPTPTQPCGPQPTNGNGHTATGHTGNGAAHSTATTGQSTTSVASSPRPDDLAKARAMVMTMGSEAVKGKRLGDLGRDVWDHLATSQFNGEEGLALQRAARLLLQSPSTLSAN